MLGCLFNRAAVHQWRPAVRRARGSSDQGSDSHIVWSFDPSHPAQDSLQHRVVARTPPQHHWWECIRNWVGEKTTHRLEENPTLKYIKYVYIEVFVILLVRSCLVGIVSLLSLWEVNIISLTSFCVSCFQQLQTTDNGRVLLFVPKHRRHFLLHFFQQPSMSLLRNLTYKKEAEAGKVCVKVPECSAPVQQSCAGSWERLDSVCERSEVTAMVKVESWADLSRLYRWGGELAEQTKELKRCCSTLCVQITYQHRNDRQLVEQHYG